VTNSSGDLLDGAGNGTPGSDFVYHFHRLAGDLNGDKAVNVLDVAVLRNALDKSYNPEADVNGDGAINVLDVGILKSQLGLEVIPPGMAEQEAPSVPANGKPILAAGQVSPALRQPTDGPVGWTFRNVVEKAFRAVHDVVAPDGLVWAKLGRMGLGDAVRQLNAQGEGSADSVKPAAAGGSEANCSEVSASRDLTEDRPSNSNEELTVDMSADAQTPSARSETILRTWASALCPRQARNT